MSTARLAGSSGSVTLLRARVQIPAWGRWWADVEAQGAESFAVGSAVRIELADVVLVGAVVSGGVTHGRAAYRVVAGAGGWSRAVDAKAYRDDVGVRRSTVLSDTAALVGETLGVLPVTRVGSHYARSAGPASRVLHDLAPCGWYVDFAGVTQIGSRAASVYAGDAPRVRVRPAPAASIDLAVESLAGLVPGVSVDGSVPATDVEFSLEADRLAASVFAGPSAARDFVALSSLLDAVDPWRRYRCVYDYRVVTQDGNALNLQPVRASAGMPDLERVPVRLAPGVRAEHYLGSLVTVAFLDGDPSRPAVVTGPAAGEPGWMPIELQLGETTPLGVARLTDPVLCGPYAGTITGASSTVVAGV